MPCAHEDALLRGLSQSRCRGRSASLRARALLGLWFEDAPEAMACCGKSVKAGRKRGHSGPVAGFPSRCLGKAGSQRDSLVAHGGRWQRQSS